MTCVRNHDYPQILTKNEAKQNSKRISVRCPTMDSLNKRQKCLLFKNVICFPILKYFVNAIVFLILGWLNNKGTWVFKQSEPSAGDICFSKNGSNLKNPRDSETASNHESSKIPLHQFVACL